MSRLRDWTTALLIGGFVSAFTLGFDGLFAWRLLRRHQARKFPRAPGVVTKSNLTRKSGTYHFEIRYDYTVDGVRYHGDRYRHGFLETGLTLGGRLYEDILRDYPIGKKIDVFYHPESPDDAVLKTGIVGWDLVVALALTVPNVFMLNLWFAFAVVLYRRLSGLPDADGIMVMRTDDVMRIRLPETTPVDAATGTVLTGSLGSALLIILFAFVFSTDPSLSLVMAVIAGIAVASAVAFYRRRCRITSGVEDLTIDFNRRLFVLPQTFGREMNTGIPLGNIVEVAVDDVVKDDGETTTHYFAPTLIYRDSGGSTQRAKLAEVACQKLAKSISRRVATNIMDARQEPSV